MLRDWLDWPRATLLRTCAGLEALLTVLVLLKLGGAIRWSWWWVLSPLWVGVPILVIIAGVMFILWNWTRLVTPRLLHDPDHFHTAAERAEAARQARGQDQALYVRSSASAESLAARQLRPGSGLLAFRSWQLTSTARSSTCCCSG
jgi:hypothetical protein